MSKFQYSLQSILDIKLKMETQAKQEFSAATGILNDEEKKLARLEKRKAELEAESRTLLRGHLDLGKIEDNMQAASMTEEKLLLQQDNVRRAEKNVERARQKLREVMIDRKTYEALREKAFEQFLIDENRAESKSIDELTSYTYGRKNKQ
ncbi:MAG: flagellar export protein FliJ [Lachnospiraceae bacterium]|nr:flagellar export protein FliJ [Lachnospiraceae bacterium]